MINGLDSRIEPCGTPKTIYNLSLYEELIFVLCLVLDRLLWLSFKVGNVNRI